MERQRGTNLEQYSVEAQVLPESLVATMNPDEIIDANQRYTRMHAAIEPLRTRGPKRFLEKAEPIPYQMAEALARQSYLGATPEELAREIYGSDERVFVSQIKSRLNNLQYALLDVGSRMTIDTLSEMKEDENKKEERWYLRYRSEEPISRTEYLNRKGLHVSHLDIQNNDHESDKRPKIREPYSYQTECLQSLEAARAEGRKKGLVVMATGTGKTAVAAFDAKQAIGEIENPRVLFVCHQSDILDRAQETFKDVLGKEYSYGFYDGRRKADIPSTNFMFATLQTLGRNLDKFGKDHFDYIVVDESHHAHAETYRPVVEHFKPGFILGITATPDRADLQDIRELFGKEVYSLPLERALAQGLLSKIDYRVMSANIDSEKVARLKQLREQDITIALLDRELFQPMALEEVVEKINERIRDVENPHVMIFTPDVDECDKVSEMMEGSVSVHSKMKEDRQGIVKALQNGEIDTAVSVDVFNEGIDIPRTNVLVFLRSTSSKTIFYQQLGRGLRKFDGKDNVLVLDFVGNCQRMRMIQELAEGVKREGVEIRASGTRTRNQDVDDIGDLEFEEISVDVLNLLGVATDNQEHWTEERLIADLRNLSDTLSRTPKISDIKKFSALRECASPGTYSNIFGTFNNALRAADLRENLKRYEQKDAHELIGELKTIFTSLERVPRLQDIRRLSKNGECSNIRQFVKMFGSLNKALLAAELTPNLMRHKDQSDDELINYIRNISKELGRVPTIKDINRIAKERHNPNCDQLKRNFGSYNNALRAAGLTPNKEYPDKEI